MAEYQFGEKEFFVNPFVFNPVPQEKELDKDCGNKRYTGEVVCHLTLKTPLIIPDTANAYEDKSVKNHMHYPFMKINDKCVIPASSLRGSIRSVYETLTDSCFVSGKDSQIITARTSKPFKCGLLKKKAGKWELWEAERYIFKNTKYKRFNRNNNVYCTNDEKMSKYSFGDKVVFEPLDAAPYRKHGHEVGKFVEKILGKANNTKETMSSKEGYLYLGESFSNKHFDSVFVEKTEEIGISENEIKEAFKKLKETQELYQKDTINRNYKNKSHGGYKHVNLSAFKDKSDLVLPIWYKTNDDNLYLSLACIGRFGYKNTLDKLTGIAKPCRSRDSKCKACSLFGMVGDKGMGSLLRFSDAHYVGNETPHLSEYTLRELGTPKYSYVPFYINAKDYQDGYDTNDTTIKGRKYYWHHFVSKVDISKDNDKNNLNATMEILNRGEFEFSVYFDSITEVQLEELKWILCLGENIAEGKYCYKFGHAKPLGCGSAKITVQSVRIREFDNEKGYIIGYDNDVVIHSDLPKTMSTESWSTLKKVMNIDYMKEEHVSYPYVVNASGKNNLKENVVASHQWFGNNYKFGNAKPNYILKNLTAKDSAEVHELPALEVVNADEYRDLYYIGKVDKILSNNRGKYGFIIDENGDSYYFNSRNCKEINKLRKNDRVTFEKMERDGEVSIKKVELYSGK